MALETSIKRVRLLKVGISGKQIESLYIQKNNFELVDVDWQEE